MEVNKSLSSLNKAGNTFEFHLVGGEHMNGKNYDNEDGHIDEDKKHLSFVLGINGMT